MKSDFGMNVQKGQLAYSNPAAVGNHVVARTILVSSLFLFFPFEISALNCKEEGRPTCTRSDQCQDVNGEIGASTKCGMVECLEDTGTCHFNAWDEVCPDTFYTCGGDDSSCDRGPSFLIYEGSCTGFNNNEYVITCDYSRGEDFCSWCGERGRRRPDLNPPIHLRPGIFHVLFVLPHFLLGLILNRCIYNWCPGETLPLPSTSTTTSTAMSTESSDKTSTATATAITTTKCATKKATVETTTTTPRRKPKFWSPKASDRLTWQWQIDGKPIDESFDVDVYSIDLFDTPAETIASLKEKGRAVICYFSAGTYEDWRMDWSWYFPFVKPDEFYDGDEPPFAGSLSWPGERYLDIRRIDLLGDIIRGRLIIARKKGCDAVELDNVDAYANPAETGLDLTAEDQLAFNRWLATEAHSVGISVGLKNDPNQLEELVDDFDFALYEGCFQFNFCDFYSTFTLRDKAVFGAEYNGDPSVFCPYANVMQLSAIKKNLTLDSWRVGCESFPLWGL